MEHRSRNRRTFYYVSILYFEYKFKKKRSCDKESYKQSFDSIRKISRRLFLRHRGPEEWWSKNATIEDWFDEMVGIANIIKKYAAVRLSDVKGRNLIFKYNTKIKLKEEEEATIIDRTFMRKLKLCNWFITNIARIFPT